MNRKICVLHAHTHIYIYNICTRILVRYTSIVILVIDRYDMV